MTMTNKRWQLSKWMTIFIMIPLVSAYSFSLDLYVPLLPTIQSALKVSRMDMQLTNSLFMLFCGFGQLVFGPLSDRLGRRYVLFGSLLITLIANLICFTTEIYRFFLIGKVLQAIGAAGTNLTCFAAVRDIYHRPEKSTEMFGYLNIANAVSAIIAPSLGTKLGSLFGWSSIFVALFIYAVVALISCYWLFAETAPYSQPEQQHVLFDYWRVFSHINYQVYTLPAAIGIGSFFAYYSISSYLYQQTYGLSTMHYSVLYGSAGLTFFIGSYTCGRLVNGLGIVKTLVLGQFFHFFGCLLVLLSGWLPLSLQLTVVHSGILLIIWGASHMIVSGIGGTMAPFQDIAGSAFALVSAYKFLMCYVLGEIVMALYDHTAMPLGWMLLVLNLCSLCVVYGFRHRLVLITPNKQVTVALTEMAKSINNTV